MDFGFPLFLFHFLIAYCISYDQYLGRIVVSWEQSKLDLHCGLPLRCVSLIPFMVLLFYFLSIDLAAWVAS